MSHMITNIAIDMFTNIIHISIIIVAVIRIRMVITIIRMTPMFSTIRIAITVNVIENMIISMRSHIISVTIIIIIITSPLPIFCYDGPAECAERNGNHNTHDNTKNP